MLGIRQYISSQTRKVKAGNSNRIGGVTAEKAHIGHEFIADVEVPDKAERLHVCIKETRISPKAIRRRIVPKHLQ